MNIETHSDRFANPFQPARESFDDVIEELRSPEVLHQTHSEVESLIEERGNELMRRLFQGYLDSRGLGEATTEVTNAEGAVQSHVRVRPRRIMSLFGPVELVRTGYGMKGERPLYPRDGELNLPGDSYTFGTRRRVCLEAVKDSYDETVEAVKKTTGASVAKRQAEELVQKASVDFDAFYEERGEAGARDEEAGPILVLSVDGKGVVMRTEDLREATRQAAEQRKHKLDKKLSPGEKRQAKRMATVASVYTVEPHYRTAEEIVGELRRIKKAENNRPSPENKRVWASLAKEPEEVINDAFEEACRRDPEKKRHWVAVVDGDEHQIRILKESAQAYGVQLTIVLDIMHVLTYLWKASHAFHQDGTPAAEQWVRARLLSILQGNAAQVAGGMRRSATLRGLEGARRKAVDTCCNYILRRTPYMHYDTCLTVGFPIATGVIEGACRHLVKDRMDVTGARWSLTGAEAVLKLRALKASGDLESYWHYHEAQELQRNHITRYPDGVPKTWTPINAATKSRGCLRLVT